MRSRRLPRCETCRQAVDACMCDVLEPLGVRSDVRLLVHHVETWKTTNTGRLAARAFGARTEPWGEPGRATPELPDGPVLLLFPSEDARPLRTSDAEGAPALVVPDGTWSQARKIARRVEAACAGRVARVRVDAPGGSAYAVLRRPPRDGALSTFEAIAHALAVLEGADGPRVLDASLALFARFVERQARSGQRLRGAAEPGPLREPP